MKNMFISTATNHLFIQLIDDSNILVEYNELIDNDMSSKLFPIIDSLFQKVNFTINEIDKIYVVNGPGSFTGVRIGVTFAKVLASMLNISICPISTLEWLASGTLNKCLALIDAKRGFVYAGIYDQNLNQIMKDSYIKLEEISENYDNVVSYDNLLNANIPSFNTIKLIEKYRNVEENPHTIKPKYLKLTEAEEKRCNND